jgi:predicted RNase H-like nuclease (RuvC/YqgF family)
MPLASWSPVSKALRVFVAEKSEKVSLQTVLNNTRTAYGRLRNEVAELEKKAAFSERECQALRQELTTNQNLLRALEATKAEIAIDIAARRAQIVDLEARLAHEAGEGKALRRRTVASTNACPLPTSGWWWCSNPSLMARVSGY